MDFQTAVVQGHGGSDTDGLLARTAALLAAARATGAMVGYIVVGFRPGYPEVSANNRSFATVRESGRFVHDAPGTEIHSALPPQDGDVVITKHRVGAFAGTDLAMILRAGRIDTLILAGIATSGVVLSTVRHAADADYRIVVAADCCGDADPEVHRCLMDKVFPRQGTVVTAAQIMAAMA